MSTIKRKSVLYHIANDQDGNETITIEATPEMSYQAILEEALAVLGWTLYDGPGLDYERPLKGGLRPWSSQCRERD